MQKYPNFLGIGAPRAGTTWLHENLKGHPELWLPYVKSLHYFDVKYYPLRDDAKHGISAGQLRRVTLVRRLKSISTQELQKALFTIISTNPKWHFKYIFYIRIIPNPKIYSHGLNQKTTSNT